MNEQDRSALLAVVTEAVTAANAPLKAALVQLLREQSLEIGAATERLGVIEDRMGAVLLLGGQLGSRLISIEVELAEIKLRLGRLSSDLITGRTQDATRYADLERRFAALESK